MSRQCRSTRSVSSGLRMRAAVGGGGALVLAFTTVFVARIAAAEPYNFFESSTSPTVSHSKPSPVKSQRSRTHPNSPARDEHKNAAPEGTPKRDTTPGGPVFGSPSLGVETSTTLKQRSFSGDVADPERDLNVGPVHQNWRPSFLGLSLKAPFSW